MTDTNRDHAMLKVLRATLKLPAEAMLYGSALAGVAMIVGNTDPTTLSPAIATFAGGLGVSLLGNVIDRLAQGEALDEETIARHVQVAIEQSNIQEALTRDEFRSDLARLAGGLNLRLLKQMIERGDRDLAARLTGLYGQHEFLLGEIQGNFEQVNDRLEALQQALKDPPQVEQTIEKMTGGTVIGIQNNYGSENDAQVLTALARLEKLLQPPAAEPLPGVAPRHVFLSYSRRDSAFVERLEQDLKARGIVTWRDSTSIVGGEDWYKSIVRGIHQAYAMIAVVTPAADESRWVLREGLYADQKGVPIIAVLPAPHRVPFHLIETQPISCGGAEYHAGLARLEAALKSLREAAAPADTSAVPDMAPQDRETELAYLNFLLADAEADLYGPRYVPLAATPERGPASFPPVSRRSRRGSPHLERLGIEQIRGDAFDQPGETVADARIPLRKLRRVVLLGDPGSGKSTTLWQLAIDLVAAAREQVGTKLPVFVELAGFDGSLDFEAYVRQQLAILASQYDRLKQAGRLILLCDALNEMPRNGVDGRDLVAEVRAYLAQQPDWVVSCREKDYHEDLNGLEGIGKVRLKPLDPPRIKQVIDRRFEPEPAQRLWGELKGSDALLQAWALFVEHGQEAAFWGEEWPDQLKPPGAKYSFRSPGYGDWREMKKDRRQMLPLCRWPYLLHLVCEIFDHRQQVPANRGALFATFVDDLLAREEAICQETGAAWIPADRLRGALAQLAYVMQRSETGTEISRAEAEAKLEAFSPGMDGALLLRLAHAANLIELGKTVRFSHQLLQEYFASEIMGMVMDAGQPATEFWPAAEWWERQGWEETATILAGVRGDPEGVARWLAPAQPEVAYQVLVESGIALDMTVLAPATQAALVEGAETKKAAINPVGRAAAYRVLGWLEADTRYGIGLDTKGNPEIDWVEIPGGDFVFGDDDQGDYISPFLTAARQILSLPTFQMARYPVTVAQFRPFVEGGYREDRYWTQAGLAWRRDRTMPALWNAPRWHIPNHPVVGVSWYEAYAFCQWLSEEVGFVVRLPTEAEWERAARGTAGLIYPYGNDFDAEKGNTAETGIGRTSAVGIFATGASPEGVLDVSGNVWEWCQTKWVEAYTHPGDHTAEGEARRCCRGGSWNRDALLARAAVRLRGDPFYWSIDQGFRVVCGAAIQSL